MIAVSFDNWVHFVLFVQIYTPIPTIAEDVGMFAALGRHAAMATVCVGAPVIGTTRTGIAVLVVNHHTIVVTGWVAPYMMVAAVCHALQTAKTAILINQ